MDLQLRDKTALITGGSKGIGRAVAEALAAEGCCVHLAARTEADLEASACAIRGRYNTNVEIHTMDLSESKNADALGQSCADVDILVNNAGAIPSGRLTELDEAGWREAWELKLFGYINLSRHIYRAMTERGNGVILNVIGGAARNPQPAYIAGAGANASLEAFTIALGKESPEFGVRVLGLHPGATRTDRQELLRRNHAEMELGDGHRRAGIPRPMPFGRMTEPAEVGDMAAFLVSPRAGYTSGVVISITGGV